MPIPLSLLRSGLTPPFQFISYCSSTYTFHLSDRISHLPPNPLFSSHFLILACVIFFWKSLLSTYWNPNHYWTFISDSSPLWSLPWSPGQKWSPSFSTLGPDLVSSAFTAVFLCGLHLPFQKDKPLGEGTFESWIFTVPTVMFYAQEAFNLFLLFGSKCEGKTPSHLLFLLPSVSRCHFIFPKLPGFGKLWGTVAWVADEAPRWQGLQKRTAGPLTF